MKKLLYCILTTVISTLFFSSCNTNNTAWQKDCGIFIQTMLDLASKSSGKVMGTDTERFKNKEVEWTLNFKEINRDIKGEDELKFDLEPFGISKNIISDKWVIMDFKPAVGTSDTWKTIASGSQVKISAIIHSAFVSIMWPSGSPDKKILNVIVSLENVRIIKNK